MVLRGQYLERPALVSCGPLVLEGLYHRGRRKPALLCCPPLDGGGMDAPVLAELAWACARAGHPSLRFQHRGCGASTGTRDPSRALDDAEAALEHLAATAPGPLAVAGLASGCNTVLALLRAHPEVCKGVLVAPRVLPDLAALSIPVLVVLPGDPRDPRAGHESGESGAGHAGDESGAGHAGDVSGMDRGLVGLLPDELPGAVGPHILSIAGADRAFRSGLPAVGRAVVGFLRE